MSKTIDIGNAKDTLSLINIKSDLERIIKQDEYI